MIFSLRHCVQTCSGTRSASNPMGTGGFSTGGKAAGGCSWQLTTI